MNRFFLVFLLMVFGAGNVLADVKNDASYLLRIRPYRAQSDEPLKTGGEKPPVEVKKKNDKSKTSSSDEPTPKSSDEPTPKSSDEPTPKSSDEPTPKSSDEPTPKSSDEPTPKSSDEPKLVPTSSDEPTPPGQGSVEPKGTLGNATDEPVPLTPPKSKKEKEEESIFGIGANFKGVFLPEAFMKIFLSAATPMTQVAFAAEFVWKKGNFELLASVDFGFYGPENGNYLGKNNNVTTDTDYIQFNDLGMLAFNVHFLWHYHFVDWVSLVYGFGIGLGVVLGDVSRVSNGSMCNTNNVENINECYPQGMDPKNREQWMAQNEKQGPDEFDDPHVFKEESWPVGSVPVVPVIDLVLGVNFKINDHFNVRVIMGTREILMLFAGAAVYYYF